MDPIYVKVGEPIPAWSDTKYNDRIREIMNIQAEQLTGWEMILKPEVYQDLATWVAAKNAQWVKSADKPSWLNITRGTDLDRFMSCLRLHKGGCNPSHPLEWM